MSHRRAFQAVLLALAGALYAESTGAGDTTVKGFVVDQKGKLGVGTSAPTEQLHVAGNSLTEGVLMGRGNSGKFGSSAVLSGFDTRYGQRGFLFSYNETGSPQTSIQIQAIDPTDPNRTVFKTFIIDHPQDPDRYLVHATLEGPEGAVYYRGSARLTKGRARIELPSYFEALTCPAGRTVQLTNVDGFDRLAVRTQGGATIRDGAFLVVSDNPASSQRFDWEVKAVRADGPALRAEPRKEELSVEGFGPYTYAAPAERRAEACAPADAGAGE